MATSVIPRHLHRLLGVLASVLLVGLVVSAPVGTAYAADGYRYWNYYHAKDGAWEFSQVGAGDFVPKDGTVEGYRYGTSTTKDPITPRVDLAEITFADICTDDEAGAGEKRVGVLLDYGTAADAEGQDVPAPRGACAVVPEDATGQQALEAVAEVRVDQSLTCGIDGYPVKGCAVTVKDAQVPTQPNVAFELPSDDADETDATAAGQGSDDTGLLWPLVGVGLLVALISAVTLAMNRRNKSV